MAKKKWHWAVSNRVIRAFRKWLDKDKRSSEAVRWNIYAKPGTWGVDSWLDISNGEKWTSLYFPGGSPKQRDKSCEQLSRLIRAIEEFKFALEEIEYKKVKDK